MIQNNTQTLRQGPWKVFLKQTHGLALITLAGLILAGSMSAQSFDALHANTGSILGTVVDTSDDPIPGATVVLHARRA